MKFFNKRFLFFLVFFSLIFSSSCSIIFGNVLTRAENLIKKGKDIEAVSLLDNYLYKKKDPKGYFLRGKAKSNLAYQYIKGRDRIANRKESVNDFQAAVNLDPRSLIYKEYLINEKIKRNKFLDVIKDVNKFIKENPNKAIFYILRAKANAGSIYESYVISKKSILSKVFDDIEKGIALASKDPKSLLEAARLSCQYLMISRDNIDPKYDLSFSRKIFEEVIALDKNNVNAYLGKSQTFGRDWVTRRVFIEEAKNIDPNYPFINKIYAQSLRGDKSKEAIKYLNKSIELNKNIEFDKYYPVQSGCWELRTKGSAIITDLYQSRAMAKNNLKDNQGAIEDYTTLISLFPEKSIHYVQRGFIFQDEKNFVQSCGDFRLAFKKQEKQYKQRIEEGYYSELGEEIYNDYKKYMNYACYKARIDKNWGDSFEKGLYKF